jgi:hypothetical protein
MFTFDEFLTEAGPRIKIVKVRLRGGKVQRRKKVSNVKGYKLKGTRLVRMSSQERMHRKMAARKARVKRRAKMARAIMKRKRTMMRRHSMGL